MPEDLENPGLEDLEDDTDTGAEAEEVAAPQGEAEAAPVKDVPQSAETNAAFAKMRRDNDELRRELQNRDNWLKNTFKEYGVDSWQAYQNKMEQQLREEKEQQLRDQGYDPELIRSIVKLDPEYRAVVEQNARMQEAMKAQEQRQKLYSEYTQLQGKFPDLVKKVEDITPDVWEKYNRGYSLTDAFMSVNSEKILSKTKQAATQKAINNIQSKAHLVTEGDGAGDDVADVRVPGDTLQMYMDMGMSRKDAYKHYKKLYG